jgi:hypothetical protein
MLTSQLVDDVLSPSLQGQPVPLAAVLSGIFGLVARHLVLVNATVARVQIAIGICLVVGYRVRTALLASIVWSLVV